MRRRITRPTLGAIQASIAFQAPPGTKLSTPKVSSRRASETQLPAPLETHEHSRIRDYVSRQWYAKGVIRPESQASRGLREQAQLRREGGAFGRGMPDWLVLVPVLLAIEVKRVSARPKHDPGPEWWLRDEWPWRKQGGIENDHSTHYGLTWAQAKVLRLHYLAGYRTTVAYGADEAIAWLDEQCGPEPSEPVNWGW